ncbi:MAG: VCBS repeat-containing protein [Rhodothermales bacterium]|nr:VCBS repeat-containing protein [Rhodothermales bacterium]
MFKRYPLLFSLPLLGSIAAAAVIFMRDDHVVHRFDHARLSDTFYSEGATFGDISGDGVMDLLSGPFWFEGPDFINRHTIYEPAPFSIEVYSDNFFAFVYDFDADGRNDIFYIGFPGQESAWYRNPGTVDTIWEKHKVFEETSNESPTFTDITGDGKPELVCVSGGRYGYAEPDWDFPERPWVFTPIAEDNGLQRFTHGMGVGDVDGDGKTDVMEAGGWFQQPPSLEGKPLWIRHDYTFAEGGSHMHAYDVDGDGDNDVITSNRAHGFGLLWYEQIAGADGGITFTRHQIMGEAPSENPYGVAFSGLHAMELVDMDGDGLKDMITGKRYWAHMGRDAGEMEPSVLYWFKLSRPADQGAHFTPYFIGDEVGVGTQLIVKDYNGDGLPDIVVGNKKGLSYYTHRREVVSRKAWEAAQPARTEGD